MRANKSKTHGRPQRRPRALAAARAPKPARTVQRKPAHRSTAGKVALLGIPRSLAAAIAHQVRLFDLNQCEPIGRLQRIECAAGVIDFTRTLEPMPVIGRGEDGTMLILSPFAGQLPPLFELTPDLCTACQVPCDECQDGMRTCTRCGGRREINGGPQPCECLQQRGKPSKKCKQCHGAGETRKMLPCPAKCDDTGKAPCDLCRGTGKMSTGFDGGKQPPNGERAIAKPCKECRGKCRRLKFNPQNLDQFTLARYGKKYVALGPIVSFTLQPLEAESPADVHKFDVLADPGPMQLVIEPGKPQSQMYMIGGRARLNA